MRFYIQEMQNSLTRSFIYLSGKVTTPTTEETKNKQSLRF
jgi:hypothetical protein